MGIARGILTAGLVVAIGMTLGGCSFAPASQVDAVHADVKKLDVQSAGHVVCEHEYDEAPLGSTVTYRYNVSVSGTSAYSKLVSRLKKNGFKLNTVQSQNGLAYLESKHDIVATVVIVDPGRYPYSAFDPDYKCKTPSAGMTQVGFSF